ncbi:hypothetical protein HC251_23580 [Iamia sp. SCSIO 61187]|uniref:hypothetical protein n=1 Tax=Iamia sp. SCSIO 61187 TaxID=2722752 RepID=UPI001C636A95|nr:hypothetical protein [Iamia sp. SCSIO 61187]QYG95113.1 hypothetical protein HC251_23580 [Iamia sp. SCSIO 61187]
MAERRRRRELRHQIPSVAPLLVGWLAGCTVLAAVAAQRTVAVEQLFLDAAFLTGEPWYTGVLSDLGVLGWTTATVAALGGGWVASQTGRPSAARFLWAAAAVSALFLADDLFQLHADLLRFVGLPKPARQLLVVVPAVVWFLRYTGEIARTRWVILAGALGGFGLSLVVDAVAPTTSTTALFLEDSAKLLGVLAWTQYMVLTSVDIVRSTIRDARAGAASRPAPLVGTSHGGTP